MRTKTLILSALLAGAASPLFAQSTVYSVNAVGYAQVVVPPNQYVPIANPLNTTNNTIGSLFPNVPFGTAIYKFNGTTYLQATFLGSWDHPDFTLNPGEGCYMFNGDTQPYTNTFVGEVMQGNLSNPLVVGYNMVSSMVPQAGNAEDLNLSQNLAFGDAVYKYNGTTYDQYVYFGGGSWSPSSPTFAIGQSAFVYASVANESWSRTFSVNN